MLQNLTLLQKQFTLVACILLVELLLIASLQILLSQSENQTRLANKALEVNIQANVLNKEIGDTASALLLYGISRNEEYDHRYRTLSTDLYTRIQSLRDAASEFPEDRECMDQIQAAAARWQTVFATCRQIIARNSNSLQLTHFLSLEVKPHLQDLNLAMADFLDHHKQVEAERKESLQHSQLLLRSVLISGGLLQLVLAFVSIMFFRRSVTKRVAVLTDNAKRLARKEPLHPLIAGSDEISLLDSNFHQMARALTEAANKERAIVDGMPAGFMTIDTSGRILSFNPRVLEMLRAKPEDLLNTNLTQWIAASDGEVLDFEKIRGASLSHVRDFEILRVDSSTFPGELSINMISSADGELLICNLLDVTERHAVERMKREFVAMVSHDLKTPLQSILASLYLLGNGALGTLTESGKTIVSKTEEEGRRLVKLVSDLLDVARMEAGRIDLELAETNVEGVINLSVSAVLSLADRKHINIEHEATSLTVAADADRLVQVLVNFLSNAVKFSPQNSTVIIACRQFEDMFEMRVTDRGPGIPPAAQQKIFERFQQVSKSDRKEKGGTGLGLAICKLIIEAHEGTLGVDSEVGQGSSFWFRIPMD